MTDAEILQAWMNLPANVRTQAEDILAAIDKRYASDTTVRDRLKRSVILQAVGAARTVFTDPETHHYEEEALSYESPQAILSYIMGVLAQDPNDPNKRIGMYGSHDFGGPGDTRKPEVYGKIDHAYGSIESYGPGWVANRLSYQMETRAINFPFHNPNSAGAGIMVGTHWTRDLATNVIPPPEPMLLGDVMSTYVSRDPANKEGDYKSSMDRIIDRYLGASPAVVVNEEWNPAAVAAAMQVNAKDAATIQELMKQRTNSFSDAEKKEGCNAE